MDSVKSRGLGLRKVAICVFQTDLGNTMMQIQNLKLNGSEAKLQKSTAATILLGGSRGLTGDDLSSLI
jgi:hypothetical protein